MSYSPQIHHRRSIRLRGYDYAQAGLYFITLCCHNRQHLFGQITNGEMILNDAGNIANECWLEIPNHFPNVMLHEYIIMPNHIHGIIQLTVGANHHSPDNTNNTDLPNDEIKNGVIFNNGAKNVSPLRSPSKTIGSVIRGYKIGVTKWIRLNTNVYDVWQRNYHEHIIRNVQSYKIISNYIINNPKKWNEDKFYK